MNYTKETVLELPNISDQDFHISVVSDWKKLFENYIIGIKTLLERNGGVLDLVDNDMVVEEGKEYEKYISNAITITMTPFSFDDNLHVFGHIYNLNKNCIACYIQDFEGHVYDEEVHISTYDELELGQLKAIYHALFDYYHAN